MSQPILALVAEGTGQRNHNGYWRDTNMWRLATQVSDRIAYVSGIGVDQRFSHIRMATGWGGKAKANQLVKTARSLLQLPLHVSSDGSKDCSEPPIVLGFAGSRGCAVLLDACTRLDIPIHAVVLFDAVYSFGLFWWQWLDQKLYPFEIPGNVTHALHVVAEHEDTPGFSPVLYPEREGLVQVRTPGDHAEVLRGPESLEIAQSWLRHLGIPLRPAPPRNGWGEPSRDLSALPSYWDLQTARQRPPE